MDSIYTQLCLVGAEIRHYESDLYVPKDERTDPIVQAWRFYPLVTTFSIRGKLWYDIPFAYDPWWERKMKKARKENKHAYK